MKTARRSIFIIVFLMVPFIANALIPVGNITPVSVFASSRANSNWYWDNLINGTGLIFFLAEK